MLFLELCILLDMSVTRFVLPHFNIFYLVINHGLYFMSLDICSRSALTHVEESDILAPIRG